MLIRTAVKHCSKRVYGKHFASGKIKLIKEKENKPSKKEISENSAPI
jgi:hypothetical protein